MNIHDCLKKLEELKLPKDQYVIVGSGPLGIRDIRESHDLDVLVTLELWEELKKKYTLTKTHPVENIDIGDVQLLGNGSMFRDPSIASIEELIKTADIFFGHPFVNLLLLKKFKQKESRDKDLKDIKLIDDFQAN